MKGEINMLIRSESENTLVDFNGSGILNSNGYVCCACGGTLVKLKNTKEFSESKEVIDKIQDAYLRGEKIVIIE